MLTGEAVNEETIASTSQLYNPGAGDWSDKLIERFGLPREIFSRIVAAGTKLGPLLRHVAEDTGLKSANVVLPGSHDTASAVLAVPASSSAPPREDGNGGRTWAYISSGTWSLMGLEMPAPVINDQCAAWNFTNEGGVAGTTRLLKNISGLWLVQECQRVWKAQGRDYDWDSLTRMAQAAPPLRSIVDPDDPRLITPRDMPAMLVALCRESGQPAPEEPGAIIRCALESLALKYRNVLGCLEQLGGAQVERIHVVGGGSQNRLLCQLAADACNRPVLAGPVEATAIGNVMMQAIAVGEVADVAQAREVIRNSFELTEYEPQSHDAWAAAGRSI
jgi:rhamnulokinase